MNSRSDPKTDATTYPLFMGYLPPKFVEKLEKEVHETPDKRKDKIEQVRILLKNEKRIRQEWFSDDDITMFLRGRKYRIQETVTDIKKLVDFVRNHESFTRPLAPDVLEKCVELGHPEFISVRNKDGCVVIVSKLGVWDPTKIRMNDLSNYEAQCMLRLLSDPMTQVNGVILLLDFKDSLSLRYMRHFTLSNCKLVYQLFMECLPLRLKAIHLLNPNWFTKFFLSVLLKLSSDKLKKRVFLHDSPEDILEHLQANTVPYEYGGKVLPQEIRGDWMKTISPPDYVLSILKSKLRPS